MAHSPTSVGRLVKKRLRCWNGNHPRPSAARALFVAMAASAMRRNAIFKRVGRIFPASDAVLGWHQASAWWGWTPSAAVAAVAAVAATSVVQTDGSSCDAALAGDAVAAELDAGERSLGTCRATSGSCQELLFQRLEHILIW